MKRINFLLLAAFCSVMAMAQNSGGADVNVDITKSGGSGGSEFPWLWIIGALVFIVLLVTLLGNRGTDRVVEKKTIIRD